VRCRVVIAEDDFFQRTILSRYFESLGTELVTVHNGRSLTAVLCGIEFHLLVLDYNLPGAEVRQIFEKINGCRQPVSVIVITGDDSVGAQESIRRLSPDFLFIKPLEMNDFDDVVRRVLKSSETEYRHEAREARWTL